QAEGALADEGAAARGHRRQLVEQLPRRIAAELAHGPGQGDTQVLLEEGRPGVEGRGRPFKDDGEVTHQRRNDEGEQAEDEGAAAQQEQRSSHGTRPAPRRHAVDDGGADEGEHPDEQQRHEHAS
ncbi:MAG: hypothetical protein ACK559_12510, partial [bacterium]